ncbi:MAG: hypothetical protein ABIH63_03965 [archaeon]
MRDITIIENNRPYGYNGKKPKDTPWGILAAIATFILVILAVLAFFNYDKITDFFTDSSKDEESTNQIIPDETDSNTKNHSLITKVINKEATKIEIIGKIPSDSLNDNLNSLRKDNSLEQLFPLEAGKKIFESPDEVYFFLSGGYLAIEGFTDLSYVDKVNMFSNTRRDKTMDYYEYELWYFDKEHIFLITFIEGSTANLYKYEEGQEQKLVTSPYQIEDFDMLAAIPLSSIISAKGRYIPYEGKDVYFLDVVIK